MLRIAQAVESAPGAGQDRVAIVEAPHLTTLIVADGSGGISAAAAAAERAIRELTSLVSHSPASTPPDWCAMLEQADRAVAATGGQCALAIAGISSIGLTGASVGDCCVWLVTNDGTNDLTDSQVRKPLLGSGHAVPVTFTSPLAGTVLVASDGLWKYVERNRISSIALQSDLETAAHRLVEAARLQSGFVQDDVTVALCRSNE